MKRLQTVLVLTLAALAFLAPAGAAERWKVLKAINWVENPTNHGRYGPKGELGPYQFRASTWKAYTSKPFSYAVKREYADEVAVRHYEWIKRGLADAGLEPSPYNIALAWNSGLGAVTSGRVPKSTYRYADQVRNLVEVMHRQAPAAPVVVAAAPAEPIKPIPVPVITLSGEAAPVRFAATVPAHAPRFVLNDGLMDIEAGDVPVVRTDRAPAAATPTAPQVETQPLFVATAIGTPRFTLID
ncbi:MAG TPA: hypothetical protein VEB66_06695 [Opitutaceae bacterium]|nr:hypothetical protein [Opitutaceae bacterium]